MNVLKAQGFIKRFTASLRYETDRAVKYLWGMGVSKENQLIHYHMLTAGPLPSNNWIRKKWHELSNAYRVDFRPAEDYHKGYILKNIALLPNVRDDIRFDGAAVWALDNFRRIGHSRGLFPPPPPKQKGEYTCVGLIDSDLAEAIKRPPEEWKTFGSKAE